MKLLRSVSSFFLAISLGCFSSPVSGKDSAAPPVAKKTSYKIKIPPSKQRAGDPEKGYNYLVQGSYIVSGVPLEFYRISRPPGKGRIKRDGDNATLPFHYTAVTAPNGVRVVTSNCLRCHAQEIGGKFVGLRMQEAVRIQLCPGSTR